MVTIKLPTDVYEHDLRLLKDKLRELDKACNMWAAYGLRNNARWKHADNQRKETRVALKLLSAQVRHGRSKLY